MPYTLPSATTTLRAVTAQEVTEIDQEPRYHTIPKGAHVAPQFYLADQDGWNSEVAVKYNDKILAVKPEDLNL